MTLLEILEKLSIKAQAHESIKTYKKLSENSQKQILSPYLLLNKTLLFWKFLITFEGSECLITSVKTPRSTHRLSITF
jgi:hypothetical protein